MNRAIPIVVLPSVIGILVAIPVGLLRGQQQWGFAASAFALCVLSGLVALIGIEYLIRTFPFGMILAIFVGSFIRLVISFGGSAIVFFLSEIDARADRIAFWLWVLFAYLCTLVVETLLISRSSPPSGLAVNITGGASLGG